MAEKQVIYVGPSFFSDGKVVPELLTEHEAIKFLRLDEDGPKNPSLTLLYYRDKDRLKATRVGKKLRYKRTELLRFLDTMTDFTKKTA